jgi:hypothetical protein
MHPVENRLSQPLDCMHIQRCQHGVSCASPPISGDRRAHQLQLEAEALALVLLVVHRAYPTGTDIEI